jgi:transcriptional regulator with PAS, ATPase and Fis domain
VTELAIRRDSVSLAPKEELPGDASELPVDGEAFVLAKAGPGEGPLPELTFRQQLRRYEKGLIEEALRRAHGNRRVAAKLLRIPLRTLFRRIRTCGVVDRIAPDKAP